MCLCHTPISHGLHTYYIQVRNMCMYACYVYMCVNLCVHVCYVQGTYFQIVATAMDDVYISALISMETRLRDCLSMVGVVSRLERPAGGFLSWDERRLVESIPFEPDQISKLVELLRKKSNDDFHRFCRILDKTGNEHLSVELRQKVEDCK